jgi:ankyrin repeat protein
MLSSLPPYILPEENIVHSNTLLLIILIHTFAENRRREKKQIPEYDHKSKSKGRNSLTKVSDNSEWVIAIKRNDCKTLLQFLEGDPKRGLRTALQTAPNGRSVLHIAIMQGCTELVHKLHALKTRESSAFKILWENAKDASMGNATALQIWSMMDADSSERSSEDYISTHPMRGPLNDEEEEEIASLRKVMSSYQKRFQMDMDDVDFNFDVRSELLIHMACSGLRNLASKSDPSAKDQLSEIGTFISTVLEDLKNQNLLRNLFNQKDARGRTILQVFVAYKYAIANENKTLVEKEFRKVLEILPSECVKACDRVGRTVLHWAVAHHSCWAVEILVESGKAGLCKTFKTGHFNDITALHLAVLYNCDDCARYLLKSNSNFNKMNLSMEINISFNSYSRKKWRPLDLAIILARVNLARRMRQLEVYFTYLIPHS